jgi:hypothetical protein
MAYCVDGGQSHNIPVPSQPVSGTWSWTSSLAGANCLANNSWHQITVTGWNDDGAKGYTHSLYRSDGQSFGSAVAAAAGAPAGFARLEGVLKRGEEIRLPFGPLSTADRTQILVYILHTLLPADGTPPRTLGLDNTVLLSALPLPVTYRTGDDDAGYHFFMISQLDSSTTPSTVTFDNLTYYVT